MALTTRRLTADHFDDALTLALEAFGDLPPGTPRPTPETLDPGGRHGWGVFEGDRLVARVVGREYHSWFGGVQVPTTGIAGVTVVAEERGRGLLDAPFAAALADGRERGEVVSTLFPTAPGIYRRFGYEVIGSFDAVEVPTAALAGVRPVPGITLRRAVAADFDAVRGVYDEWAAAQNGPLTRRGPSFGATAQGFIEAFTGVTLAVDETGQVVGFVSWKRGRGYGEEAVLEVSDLMATHSRAYPALWRLLAGFASVTPAVRLHTSGIDAARLALPTGAWRLVGSRPYMLRITDVEGAFSLLPHAGRFDVAFAVEGDGMELVDARYRVRVEDDTTSCVRTETVGTLPTYTRRGLALAWSGAQNSANLRIAGLLTGPTDHDSVLDALTTGRPIHIRDYF